jgi:hypothetical protein
MTRTNTFKLITCLVSSFIFMTAYADYNSVKSGKRKLAYAPYQKISFTHVSSQKLATNKASVSIKSASLDVLSEVSIENIVERAKGLKTNSEGMIAAGWPGGKTGSQPTAPSGANPHAKPNGANPHAKPNGANPYAKPNGANPHAKPTSAPSSQSNQPSLSGFVYGQLHLDESLKSKVKAGSVLFIIVRRSAPKGQKGMMIAATKLDGVTVGAFPLKYVVKQSDAMMGAPLAGKVNVSARIDQDGDAISKQAGDIIGSAEADVMVGVNPVIIKLNKTI